MLQKEEKGEQSSNGCELYSKFVNNSRLCAPSSTDGFFQPLAFVMSEHTPSRFEFCASSETGDLVAKIAVFTTENKIGLHKIKEALCTFMLIFLTWLT